ncbi:Stk1 family PASTA domain-containing Ser/Thr kinase [Streptomyces sp. MI02-7b]|uniref:Stk1 family PASTA domain-containing Ser/Thr kinase n=1 Tax=Streptomyces sp. MI02-7b TaxID=462941 RepID=UPI0029B8F0B0|nr:protein kinase [Streptomyces sp. MI02-7b]MDX3073317.1 protein kinase [Streptomyces sp. MI02-7b]
MGGDGAQGTHAGRSVGGGRYVLRDLLGQGGMASVHLAHDTVLDRPVAVKTLHTDLGREQSFRERFRREAQAVAKLNHPNIVSVFDSGEDTVDGAVVPYIVMEYVEGKPLRTVLDEDIAQFGAMPTEKALKIVSDVLAALSESHSVGLVHRDIKPGNVMLTRRGVVKVMDFGIARAMQSGVTSMTQTGMVVGTPQYLSPEQALGRGVDERSDLYSVGCMLFELLTGRLPFDGDSPLSIAYQHVQEMPPAPSGLNRVVTPGVDALVARALRKNPAERFPTADAMKDETDRVAAPERGAGTTPLIIGEGPRARGRGEAVSQAVFPPVQGDLRTPQPPVRQPYQPHPSHQSHQSQTPPAPYQAPQHTQHTPQQAPLHGGWGQAAQTPPPASRPAYGYPQNGGQQHPAQHSTTPYTLQPNHPSGGGRRGGGGSTAVVAIGATVAVIAIVVVVAIVLSLNKDNGTGADNGAGGRTPTDGYQASAPATDRSTGRTPSQPTGDDNQPAPGVSQADQSRTIDAARCTEATKNYQDDNSVIMPDFFTKYVDSVKACMTEAGWKYQVKYRNEQVYGKGAVIDQQPRRYDPLKAGDTVTIWVSTGESG